jgi:hypothetical protein
LWAYVFIDKNIFLQNKKRINKFINQDEYIAKFIFEKNSDMTGMVEIFVEHLDDFDYFVEHMFRKLGKDVIAYVGISIGFFDDLKKMNVMIPEIKEKMWEMSEKYSYYNITLAKANDFKLVELLSDYDILFNVEDEYDEEVYTRSINDKISEYRAINNEKPYHATINL